MRIRKLANEGSDSVYVEGVGEDDKPAMFCFTNDGDLRMCEGPQDMWFNHGHDLYEMDGRVFREVINKLIKDGKLRKL